MRFDGLARLDRDRTETGLRNKSGAAPFRLDKNLRWRVMHVNFGVAFGLAEGAANWAASMMVRCGMSARVGFGRRRASLDSLPREARGRKGARREK